MKTWLGFPPPKYDGQRSHVLRFRLHDCVLGIIRGREPWYFHLLHGSIPRKQEIFFKNWLYLE